MVVQKFNIGHLIKIFKYKTLNYLGHFRPLNDKKGLNSKATSCLFPLNLWVIPLQTIYISDRTQKIGRNRYGIW